MYGFHLNTYDKEIKKLLLDNNCQIYQCFIKEYKKLKDYQPELKPVIHGSFFINLSSDLVSNYYILQREIKFCLKNNIKYYVLHIGKCTRKMNISTWECINNMLKLLKRICKKFKLYDNKNFNLCLEMLSGEDNDLLYSVKDLRKTLFNNHHYYFKNLKICLDTCHIYASGVDISTIEGFNKYIKELNDLIGLKSIGLIHLNNSTYELNSRKDKHADIDKGFIKTDTMVYMFNYFKDNSINVILELKDIKHNIKFIKN